MATKTKSGNKSDSGSSSSSGPKKVETTSTVTARHDLEQGQISGDAAEKRAKDQEKRQQEELRRGQVSGEEKKLHDEREKLDRASTRAPVGLAGQGAIGGVVDGMTRRDDGDALTGHFVSIDRTHNDLSDDAKELLDGRDGYGVYLAPASTDPETGYPVTAVVQLRDDTNARIVVPHDSLRPAVAGGR